MSSAQPSLDFDDDEDFGLGDEAAAAGPSSQPEQRHQVPSTQVLEHQAVPSRAAAAGNSRTAEPASNRQGLEDDYAFDDISQSSAKGPSADTEGKATTDDAAPKVANVADANLLEEEIGGPDGYVYVGDLHWWTTDADLEQECRRFGRVKDIKFFEDGLNGKSKGAAKVTFSAQQAAALCLAEMNGHAFNGRKCVVTLPADITTQDPVRPVSPAPRPASQQQQGYAGSQRGQARPYGRPPGGHSWNNNAGSMPPMPGQVPMGLPMMPPMPGVMGMGAGLPMGFMPPGFLPPGLPFPPSGQWQGPPRPDGGYKRPRY